MVLESLGSSLRSVLRRIAGASHVDENLIKEVVRDIQRALLQADVNVNLTLNITKGVQRRATDEKPPAGMSPREHVIRIIYEELVKVLGKPKDIALGRQRILFVGLYGQGKTTSIAKLARFFQKRGLSVALVACDTHRPAAYDQLRQLGDSISVPVLGGPQEKDARKVAMQGVKDFDNMDVAIFDSSGRHSLEADLIQEIKDLAAIIKPDEIILAMDATTGQQAGPQAKAFHEAVGVTSVILTKLDGSAKGGGALSAVAETKAPIVFVGVGEKIEDFEKFDPPRFISRLLGMGDLQSLLEKAQEAMDQEKAEETAKKILSGRFTLREMYDQMEMLTKMGSLRKIFSMLPGIPGKMSDEDLDATQERLLRQSAELRRRIAHQVEIDRQVKAGVEEPEPVEKAPVGVPDHQQVEVGEEVSPSAGVRPEDAHAPDPVEAGQRLDRRADGGIEPLRVLRPLGRQVRHGGIVAPIEGRRADSGARPPSPPPLITGRAG